MTCFKLEANDMDGSSFSGMNSGDVISDTSSFTTGIRGRNTLAPEVDRPLPVVELKPFTREVWRREKSLPEFYDKFAKANDGQWEGQFHMDPSSDDINKKDPSTAAAKYLSKYLDEDRRGQSRERLSIMASTRYKMKMHPSVDFSYNYRPQKIFGLIKEFIPRPERTKTTLKEVTCEDNTNREYSCVKQALNDDMAARQQEIKVHGGPVQNSNDIIRTHLMYLNPWEHYNQLETFRTKVDSGAGGRSVSPVRSNAVSRRSRYDFDKSSTASSDSLSVSNKGRRQRGLFQPSIPSMGNKQSVSVNIGGVKNSFQALSEAGPPSKIERQLSFEMELNMEYYKRHQDLLPSDGTGYYSQGFNPNMFHDVTRGAALTRGEESLKQGRDKNRRRQGKNTSMTDFDRNLRPIEAADLHSGPHSPGMNVLESAFHNGIFDKASDKGSVRQKHLNHGNLFSKGRKLHGSSSKRDKYNSSPSTDTMSVPTEPIARETASTDLQLQEFKDSAQGSPITTSCVSGFSNSFSTYITEASGGVGSKVMSLDSRVDGPTRNVQTQTMNFTKAHFKPCGNVSFQDGGLTPEAESSPVVR